MRVRGRERHRGFHGGRARLRPHDRVDRRPQAVEQRGKAGTVAGALRAARAAPARLVVATSAPRIAPSASSTYAVHPRSPAFTRALAAAHDASSRRRKAARLPPVVGGGGSPAHGAAPANDTGILPAASISPAMTANPARNESRPPP